MKIASDVVEIEFNGSTYWLSKLGRHILYCLLDDRAVSSNYSAEQVEGALEDLVDLGLVEVTDDGVELLTPTGDAVALELKSRPR